ncbi:hypothetical protein ACFLTJ_03970 [Chloroflexota bacterium]
MSVTADAMPGAGGVVSVNGDTAYSLLRTSQVSTKTPTVIEAIAAPGYRFLEWTGNLTGYENPMSLDMNQNIRITANFVRYADVFTSQDKMLSVLVPEGTTARNKAGAPFSGLQFRFTDTSPALPPGGSMVGPAYDIGPDGATFDPPITLSWNYDPLNIPPGVAEEALAINYYDETAEEWLELPSQVEAVSDTITASVAHFSTFAMMCYPDLSQPYSTVILDSGSLTIIPQEVSLGEAVSINVLASNSGEEESSLAVTLKIDDVAVQTKEPSLAGGSSQPVAFVVSPDEAGAYSVDVNGLTGLFVVGGDTLTGEPPAECGTLASTLSSGGWGFTGSILAAVAAAIAVPLIIKRRRR